MIEKPLNVTLPASSGTATLVRLPVTQTCNDFVAQARGDVAMKISDVEAMTTYWTVKAGSTIGLAEILGTKAKLFYAIASADAADVIEIMLKK